MESKWKIPGFLIENRGYALHIDLKVCSLLGSDPVKEPAFHQFVFDPIITLSAEKRHE